MCMLFRTRILSRKQHGALQRQHRPLKLKLLEKVKPGSPSDFSKGVAIWGPLKRLGWHAKSGITSFIMLLSNVGYLKNTAKKRERKANFGG